MLAEECPGAPIVTPRSFPPSGWHQPPPARTPVIDLDPQDNSLQYLPGKGAWNLELPANEFCDQMLSFKLREALDALGGYDEIFIDTPPAFGQVWAQPDLRGADLRL